jgi:putative transposase
MWYLFSNVEEKCLYEQLRSSLEKYCESWFGQKETQVEEGHLMLGHVHALISIPPKYSGLQV